MLSELRRTRWRGCTQHLLFSTSKKAIQARSTVASRRCSKNRACPKRILTLWFLLPENWKQIWIENCWTSATWSSRSIKIYLANFSMKTKRRAPRAVKCCKVHWITCTNTRSKRGRGSLNSTMSISIFWINSQSSHLKLRFTLMFLLKSPKGRQFLRQFTKQFWRICETQRAFRANFQFHRCSKNYIENLKSNRRSFFGGI